MAPMAVASDGSILLNIALAGDQDIVKLVERALAEGGTVFVGVAITEAERVLALKRADDAAAETVGWILGGRQRRRRLTARRIRKTPS